MAIESKIKNFLTKIKLGISWFEDAGQLLAGMIDDDPRAFDDITQHQDCPKWVTTDVLHTFEMIGRKQLSVEAMFLPRHVISRLIELPVDEQARIVRDGVPVVRMSNGGHHIVNKPAQQLTPREACVAIGPSGVRTVEEQSVMSTSTKNLGKWELTLMNGKPFLKQYTGNKAGHRVVLTNSQAVIEIFQTTDNS
jgi:hypothetical protein